VSKAKKKTVSSGVLITGKLVLISTILVLPNFHLIFHC
jgi:hypothetical protein